MGDTFEKALAFTLKYEGGFVDNPADRGGPTNQGITQKTYDAYRKQQGLSSQDVRKLSVAERDWIYRRNYWDACKCDSKPPKLAIACFDFAVNSGPSRALSYYRDDLEEYLNKRKLFFITIAKGSQHIFYNGWLNRLEALRHYLLDL